MAEYTMEHNKFHRTIPNILRNSSKLSALGTKCCSPGVLNTNKDKQLPLIYELPKYNVPKNQLDKKENRRKQKMKSSLVHVPVHNKGFSSCKNGQRSQTPSIRNERKVDLSLTYQNVSTNFLSKHQIELEDAEDSIDFSSNEIFNKFNYEYSNDIAVDSSWHIRDSDDTCNSYNIADLSYPYIDESDVNGNEIDIFGKDAYTLSSKDEQIQRHITKKQSLVFPEYLSTDTLFICDKESEISCESSCDHYCKNSNWFKVGETQNHIDFEKNILFANTSNESSESTLSSLCPHSPIIFTNSFLQDVDEIDSSLGEFASEACKRNDQKQEYNDISLVEVEEDHIELCDSTGETNFNEVPKMKSKETKIVYDTITSEIKDGNESSENIDELLCSLCGLVFSNWRTIAMHQADAHGDLYTIRCETCGRLFNRKYHCNRHALHCGNSKEFFKCNKCPKIYRYKSSLVRHLNVVHHSLFMPELGTLKCNFCGKIYKHSRAFEKHVKSHDGLW